MTEKGSQGEQPAVSTNPSYHLKKKLWRFYPHDSALFEWSDSPSIATFSSLFLLYPLRSEEVAVSFLFALVAMNDLRVFGHNGVDKRALHINRGIDKIS